ncbi:serine hydrolase domain-containing protein [Thermoactinospora rubra]|uniref:serine hydrolase domain-containing protein n=1 Tax=Thermoactinospora rubra TaxID=1088767 RepID=UPI000A1053F4|nr:serine hydrolase domain-containing protein [Thermoactinospora rubra]
MDGHCDPRFARVREQFGRQLESGEELGAAFAVYRDGELVVDLWGGVADRHTGRPWERDTPAFAYSCTKAVTATVLLQLVERGLLRLDTPVAEVWPEFGKPAITVEHLLTHQAGLPVIEEEVPVEEFEDQAAIAARLAGQRPLWEPGTAHGYHALTYGFLIGEVVRRVAGKSVGELTAAEIAGPLGLDLWIGAPDDVIERAARLTAGDRAGGDRAAGDRTAPAAPPDPPGALGEMARAFRDRDSLANRALGNPGMQRLKGGANHPVIMRAGWPAAGMVTTARSLAGFYRALVAGEILRPGTLQDALRRRVTGPDRVLHVESSFGLGFMRPALTFFTPRRGAETAFGHTGMGGFIGLGDVANGLAVGYVMNRMSSAFSGGLRGYLLLEAVYDSL